MRWAMRGLAVLLALAAGRAEAETLQAVRASVMCEDAGALGRLALPQGGSRDAGANASPAIAKIAQDGGCTDFPAGHVVVLKTARKHTSIVTSDSLSGDGVSITVVVANIDFAPYLPPHTPLNDAVRAQCPGMLDMVAASGIPGSSEFVKSLPKPVQDEFARSETDCNPVSLCDRIEVEEIEKRHLVSRWAAFLCAHPNAVEPADASQTMFPR